MLLRHSLDRLNIAEHPVLLLIVSSHAATTNTSRCGLGVIFQQPARHICTLVFPFSPVCSFIPQPTQIAHASKTAKGGAARRADGPGSRLKGGDANHARDSAWEPHTGGRTSENYPFLQKGRSVFS